MSQITRSALYALILENILDGGKRTTGENMREVLNAIVESMVSAPDDANANLGYPKIDSSGKLDVTKIKQDTPETKFLRDNGTWDLPTVALLTGLSIAGGNIAASDTLLAAMGKLQGKFPAITDVTGAAQPMVSWGRYMANNGGARVDFRLPATAAVGDPLWIRGCGAAGWRISQVAGQQIRYTGGDTTLGAGGRIDSGNQDDCIELMCIVQDTTWIVCNHTGTLTIA